MLSHRASAISIATHGADQLNVRRAFDGQSDPGNLFGAGDHARSRASDLERQYRELPRPSGDAGSSLADHETLAPLQRVIAVGTRSSPADDRIATIAVQ